MALQVSLPYYSCNRGTFSPWFSNSGYIGRDEWNGAGGDEFGPAGYRYVGDKTEAGLLPQPLFYLQACHSNILFTFPFKKHIHNSPSH